MPQATQQQQIDLLKALDKNKDVIIDKTAYEDDEDDVDAYSAALKATAAQVLNMQPSQMDSILRALHFTCDVGDKSGLGDDMYYILFSADIKDLIRQVEETHK